MNFEVFLGILALYLYLIMPRIFGRRSFEPFIDRYYAHRGLYDNASAAPENSLPAFRLAIENNYGIEFDIQLSKDQIPVVFHDKNLKRVCGMDKYVWELTYEELRSLRIFGSNEAIPVLQDVLELIEGNVPIIVEYKIAEGTDTRVCEIVAPYLDRYDGEYCIESFNPFALLWYKKNRPSILRGQLSMDYSIEKPNGLPLDFILKYLMFNFMTKPDFIAFNHLEKNNLSLLLNKYIFKILLVAYTIKSKEELEKNKKFFKLLIFEGFKP